MAKPRAKSKAKKKKLSRSPEAVRSRKRRAEAKREAERAERKRKARNRDRRERRRLERESLAETERQRELEVDERAEAISWLEMLTPVGASLTITEAEVASQTPWLVVGKIDLAEAVSYGETYAVLQAWESDFVIEAAIHPDRLSQIRIVYNDPTQGFTSESWVSESGPWAALVSDLAHEIDPDNPDSLANRYTNTAVPTIYVYFSSAMAQTAEIG